MAKKIERCQVVRNHSGDEGRAKSGDIYIVQGEPVPGMVKITLQRFMALAKNGLVIPIGVEGSAAPGKRPAKAKMDPPAPNKVQGPGSNKVDPDAPGKVEKPKTKPGAAPTTRTGSRPTSTRSKSSKTGQPGSQPGKPAPRASSSAAASPPAKSDHPAGTPAESTTAESAKRGKRRGSASSPLTTHGASPHGGIASTPAIGDGGSNTKNPADDSAGLG